MIREEQIRAILASKNARSNNKYASFMSIAQAFAAKSKYDGHTKVGAVILGPGFEVRSGGWNGSPRRCCADVDHRSFDRDERLFWAVHAEANAITNAARTGTPIMHCTMVVTHLPCMSCAKLIVQAGIVRVISPTPNPDFASRWTEDFRRTAQLFSECGVELVPSGGTSG